MTLTSITAHLLLPLLVLQAGSSLHAAVPLIMVAKINDNDNDNCTQQTISPLHLLLMYFPYDAQCRLTHKHIIPYCT